MFVKQRIELDFQVDEFLESAKDAFYMGASWLHTATCALPFAD